MVAAPRWKGKPAPGLRVQWRSPPRARITPRPRGGGPGPGCMGEEGSSPWSPTPTLYSPWSLPPHTPTTWNPAPASGQLLAPPACRSAVHPPPTQTRKNKNRGPGLLPPGLISWPRKYFTFSIVNFFTPWPSGRGEHWFIPGNQGRIMKRLKEGNEKRQAKRPGRPPRNTYG